MIDSTRCQGTLALHFTAEPARFPGPGGQWQISTEGGTSPRWRADGKELYYLSPDNKMMAAAGGVAGGRFVPKTRGAVCSASRSRSL
jgi:hypothetical protein